MNDELDHIATTGFPKQKFQEFLQGVAKLYVDYPEPGIDAIEQRKSRTHEVAENRNFAAQLIIEQQKIDIARRSAADRSKRQWFNIAVSSVSLIAIPFCGYWLMHSDIKVIQDNPQYTISGLIVLYGVVIGNMAISSRS